MTTTLSDLSITEISVVDKGANPGAKAVLVKRDGEAVKKDDEAKGLLRRIGEMLGLSKPYGDNADPADSDEHGLSFDAAYKAIEAREYAADILSEVQEASEALYRSIHSILDDEEVSDPEAAVRASVDQFKAHMAKLVPEELEKALVSVTKALTAGSAGNPQTVNKGDSAVTEDVNKALADKDAEIARLTEVVKGSYSKEEVEAMDKMDDAGKAKFRAMSADERKAAMCKGDFAKRDDLPEDIRKALGEAEDLKKRLAALEADRERDTFAKRAADAGLTAEWAEHLQVITKVSPKAAEAVEALAKSALEIEEKSPLFKELGSSNGPDANSALNQLIAKRDEIAKRDNVSEAGAFARACNENPDLYRQYVAENR